MSGWLGFSLLPTCKNLSGETLIAWFPALFFLCLAVTETAYLPKPTLLFFHSVWADDSQLLYIFPTSPAARYGLRLVLLVAGEWKLLASLLGLPPLFFVFAGSLEWWCSWKLHVKGGIDIKLGATMTKHSLWIVTCASKEILIFWTYLSLQSSLL